MEARDISMQRLTGCTRTGIFGIPTIALAKKEGPVFRPDRAIPLRLSRDWEALHVLQHIRDEATVLELHITRNSVPRISRNQYWMISRQFGEKRKRNLLADLDLWNQSDVQVLKR